MEANDVNLHNFVWNLVDCFDTFKTVSDRILFSGTSYGKFTDKLDKISVTADALQLWVREKIAEGNITSPSWIPISTKWS